MSAILSAIGYTVLTVFVVGMIAGCLAAVVVGRVLAGR